MPSLIGIGKASVFMGFCSVHDEMTFRRIDREPVLPDQEQAFLLAYRALSREVVRVTEDLTYYSRLERLCANEPGSKGIRDRGIASDGLQDASSWQLWSDYWRRRYEEVLLQKTYARVGFFAISFSQVPEFACAGWGFPTLDFQGRTLRPDKERVDVKEAVALSVVPQGHGGIAVLSWVGKPDGEGSRLANSLRLLPLGRLPDAILRFALVHFENVYMNPVW